MSQENVELVQRSLAELARTGEPAWWTLHEEVEVRDHDIPDAPLHRGHDGLAQWVESWSSAWDEWHMEPEEFLDAGDRVVVVFRMVATGKASGVALERRDAIVYGFRDGKISALDYYNDRGQALEAAGLRA